MHLERYLFFWTVTGEVNKEWLPPLLERIKDDSKTVVCPMIDIISSDTFEYQSSPLVRGGFNWGLHFSWEPVPNHLLAPSGDVTQPIRYGGRCLIIPM